MSTCAQPCLKLNELPLSHFAQDGNLEGLRERLRLASLALGSSKSRLSACTETEAGERLTLADFVNARDEKGYTAVHWAAYFDERAILQELMACDEVDMNAVNSSGGTALHIAALLGSPRCLSLMLEAGVPAIDAPNSFGERALHLAAGAGHAGVVAALLDAGAVLGGSGSGGGGGGGGANEGEARLTPATQTSAPEELDRWGRTPYDVAWEHGHTSVQQVFGDRFKALGIPPPMVRARDGAGAGSTDDGPTEEEQEQQKEQQSRLVTEFMARLQLNDLNATVADEKGIFAQKCDTSTGGGGGDGGGGGGGDNAGGNGSADATPASASVSAAAAAAAVGRAGFGRNIGKMGEHLRGCGDSGGGGPADRSGGGRGGLLPLRQALGSRLPLHDDGDHV